METKERPLVSVVMPAYKAEKTIEAAIESVLRQSWEALELIVVDDASPDTTGEILHRISASDPRVSWYRNETNRGVSYNRNFGVRKAAGEWIAFLDSDDMWEPDKLEKQLRLAAEHPEAGLFFTGSSFIDSEGRQNSYILRVPEKVDFSRLLGQNVISCSSVLVRKDRMLAHPMGNDSIHEDFAVWLEILREEPYAYAVNEPLLIYRVSRSSKSGNKLRAAKMTFQTYRAEKVPFPLTLWKGVLYTLRGIRKFRRIGASWVE